MIQPWRDGEISGWIPFRTWGEDENGIRFYEATEWAPSGCIVHSRPPHDLMVIYGRELWGTTCPCRVRYTDSLADAIGQYYGHFRNQLAR